MLLMVIFKCPFVFFYWILYFGDDKYISYVEKIDNFMVIPKNISPPVGTPHKPGCDQRRREIPSPCTPPHGYFPPNTQHEGVIPLKLPLMSLHTNYIFFCIKHTKNFQLV